MRRWEDKEGLPVHRHQHDKRGSVYGYAWEIDAWRESRRQLLETEPPDLASTAMTGRRAWPWISAGGALVLVASIAGFWSLERPAAVADRKPNPEAVRLTELANFGLNAGREQIQTGIRYYQDAIRLDPEYAPAWVGLATGHLVLPWFAEVAPSESITKAKMEAQQALHFDPTAGSALRVLAAINHYFDWDQAAAEAQYRKAIDGNPVSGVSFSWFGDFLLDMRRFEEARLFYKRAQEAAPRWLEPIAFAGNAHFFSGNPDLAIVEYQRTLASEPNFGLGNHFLGRALVAKGEYEKGIERLRKSNELLGEGPFSTGDLGYGLAIGGKRTEAEGMLANLLERRARGYYPAFPISLIHLGLGHHDEALDWLERAADERHMGFYFPSVDQAYDALRSHPRFKAIMQRAGLPH